MQTKYIILQVLALFLLVLIRKTVRFDRNGDNSGEVGAASNATPADTSQGLPCASRKQNDLSNHCG
jgi:hypothetical protein